MLATNLFDLTPSLAKQIMDPTPQLNELVLDSHQQGCVFRLEWPNVEEVFICGEFNRWSVPGCPMRLASDGLWEIFIRLGEKNHTVGFFAYIAGRITEKRYLVLANARGQILESNFIGRSQLIA